ncbi:ATP-grasp domain-containing protein [Lysinibacillus halotolerans]|uniref:ATP-grasp domain-containing protein n=1 Tax=Lysinibacillus halotolerans TaxID=1368476 RepID=A0A3M8H4V6_9BACI|nr:ATP-grasp domain-containing protein [Lysinibacillus halotolerans]RNC97244.1 ATP-grasp domain-containing protein [Lysinibacillus halotolerans]
MKKRVILINAHPSILQKAKNLNLEVLHLYTKDNSYKLNDNFINIEVDYEKMEEDLSKLVIKLNKEKEINFVLSFSETGLIIMAYLNELLGLNFINIKTIETLNNKIYLREMLNKNNISPLNFMEGNDLNDVITFYENHGPPFIVKPKSGYASKSIILIENKNDIHKKDFTHAFPAIIEDFIQGDEFSVESFSINGQHFIIGITSKETDSSFVEKSHTVPAILNVNEEKAISLMINNMLDLVELKNGCAHTEIKIHNGIPKIIESHARPGGDGIPELIQQVYGFDFFLETMKLAMGEFDDISFMEEGAASVCFFSFANEGIISNINKDILEHKNIIKYRLRDVNIGDNIFPVKESSDRLGYIMVKELTPQKAFNLSHKLAEEHLEIVFKK